LHDHLDDPLDVKRRRVGRSPSDPLDPPVPVSSHTVLIVCAVGPKCAVPAVRIAEGWFCSFCGKRVFNLAA